MKKAREIYSPGSRRAALVYFVILEMHQVTPMFRFSLTHFLKTFQRAIAYATKVGGRSLQLITQQFSDATTKSGKQAAAARRNIEAAVALK